jgi:phosphoadenosine phosphosulfate reductase
MQKKHLLFHRTSALNPALSGKNHAGQIALLVGRVSGYTKTGIMNLKKANERLLKASTEEIIRWTHENFKDSIAMTTAFGYSGVALIDMVIKIIPDIKLYFIDTGYHFRETLDVSYRLEEFWNIEVTRVKPTLSKDKVIELIGEKPYLVNADLCCHYNKVEPLLTFIHKYDVWMSGIRRDQSNTRESIQPVEMDGRGVIKVSPMYNWTRAKTWKYIRDNKIPYNPLHDEGYPSIGCYPCTKPVEEGGNERDGRWRLMQKMECGIHLNGEGNGNEEFDLGASIRKLDTGKAGEIGK